AMGNRCVWLHLRRLKSIKSFAILPHGPPSVHEARLGQPEQPSLLLPCERAGRRPQPEDITSKPESVRASCREGAARDYGEPKPRKTAESLLHSAPERVRCRPPTACMTWSSEAARHS